MENTAQYRNPRDRASWLSIIFFWWMNNVLTLGNKRPLTDGDLFPLLQDYKAEVLVQKAEQFWFDELEKSQSKPTKARLWKVMARLIPWQSRLVLIVLKVIWSLSFVFLPLCLWLALKTLNDGPDMEIKFALMYVALLALASLVRALSTQHYDYLTELWGLKLKVALIGLVYNKLLSLNRYNLEATMSGNTINLVSNDAQKIEKSLNNLGLVLFSPLELTISLVILWFLIGWEALVGAAFYFVLVAFQILMARKAAKLREKAAAFTDKRLVVMNEIISGIRAVKMYAWEWNFRDVVRDLRRKEMSIIRFKGIIVSMLIVFFFITIPIGPLISITTLVLTGTNLSSFEIFTVLLGLVTIRHTFCYHLGIAMQVVADAKVALDRIQVFLEGNTEETAALKRAGEYSSAGKDNLSSNVVFKCKGTKNMKMAVQLSSFKELDVPLHENYQTVTTKSVLTRTENMPFTKFSEISLEACKNHSFAEPYVSITDVSCSWKQDVLSQTLNHINLQASNGDMIAITGAVGSGKSSFLTAILGELPLSKGEISYRGKVAYVPQIPWVFSGTIRENILFGLPFNQEKLQRVVEVCGLTKDLADFTNGDLTEIGQRGVTLSGGQKARVGLARAVYSDADIYLLDDPLSAVDTKVGRKLYESSILDYLSGRIRLLVTHQLQYLKDVARIIVMENGSFSHQGGYTELTEQGVFFDSLELLQLCENEARRARRASLYEFSERGDILEVIKNRPRSISALPSSNDHALKLPKPLTSDVTVPQRAGVVTANISPRRSRSVSVYEFREEKIIQKLMQRPPISLVSSRKHTEGKDNMGFVGSLELPTLQENESCPTRNVTDEMTQEITNPPVLPSTSDVFEADHPPALDLKEEEESKMAGTVTWRLYWDYFRAGLPVPLILLLAFVLVLAQVCLLAPNWWLSRMAEMSHDQQRAPITQVIHACLVAVSTIVVTASSFVFYYLLLKAAENLHNKMTVSTIKAPVLFFDRNPAGRILNRFSKDIGCMDDVLPPLFLQAVIICLFSLCAMLVPAATNYWLFLALLPIIGIYVYYARYYLKSSRELKRIEAIRYSPVYSHITETANGLEIVHTSNMNREFQDRLHRYQDENTQALFMVVSSNRWLGIRLDLLSSVFVSIVAVTAILITENPALAGLALVYALQTLDLTQLGVRMASEVENLMTSVERVMTYTEIDSEPGYSNQTRPPESWPNEGCLAVQDLFLIYFEGGPRVLKNISFCVSGKEKVGIVGRTGAGKSSLVSALFRMPEPLGKVSIDGVNVASIDLQEARRSMAVITQDPVLFGGTLKRNMDPFAQCTDQDLWTALEEVQLTTLVEDLPGQLEFKLKEGGTNLSVGERQLVCLARALVQKSKIIVMDEATANVDFKTDRLIQEVIRDKFRDSTVLTIAHRLNTIMDYDKVLVLDGGRVVEFDKPEVLIRKGGLFSEMVRSQKQSTVKQ
ncbi:ATP-binding cassette sub-family C member 4-like isoform X2 [Oculina patagonica]